MAVQKEVREMRKRYMLGLVFIVLILIYQISNSGEMNCRNSLVVCSESCVKRGGIMSFACVGDTVETGRKMYCRCMDE